MSNQLAPVNGAFSAIEQVIINGDLSKLSPEQRVEYYMRTCDSLGLNPLTKPFDYITLNGKLTLYPRREATEQLRKNHGVSITKLERDMINGVYVVTAYAQSADGRQDSSTGAVNTDNLKGDALANAMMKAETKAKRRVTLSICGLGMLDESEVSSVPGARPVIVSENGEIVGEPEPEPMHLEAALEYRTNNNTRFGDLAPDQLQKIKADSKRQDWREAAAIILESMTD